MPARLNICSALHHCGGNADWRHATALVPAPSGEDLRSLHREVVSSLTDESLEPLMSATETTTGACAKAVCRLRSEKVDQAQAIFALAAALLPRKILAVPRQRAARRAKPER